MKRARLISLMWIFGFLSLGLNSQAQHPFRYKRQILEVGQEGWYMVNLPPEIFRDLNPHLSDIRLYDISGADTVELPYLLRILEDEVVERQVDLPLFNASYSEGVLFLTFELRSGYSVNLLNFEFEERNYFAHVTIEGSDDRATWFDIAKNQRIVSIAKQDDDYTLSSIRFPMTRYRYLRLKVQADTTLHLKKASFAYDSVRQGIYRSIPLKWTVRSDKTTRMTTADIALDEYGPVSNITVGVNHEMDYYRSFRLDYLRDSSRINDGWFRNYQPLVDGHLTSFDTNAFSFPTSFTSRLRMQISDKDNAPLKITSITATGPVVAVIAFLKPGNNFLFYGAGPIREPSYDLAHFSNRIPDKPLAARLSSAEDVLPIKGEKGPLFENPLWLWSILGVMIAGLGFFTIRMMKGK